MDVSCDFFFRLAFLKKKNNKKFQITKGFCKNIRKNWGPITDNKF